MFDPDLTDQIKKLFFTQKINLNQLWSLVVLAGVDKLAPSTAKPDHDELVRARKAVKVLQTHLGFELLSDEVDDDGAHTRLTPAGIELVGTAMRFFEDSNGIALENQKHGRSVRIGSSATLLHWLVLPNIEALQARTAEFETSRQPELGFMQIERDEVRNGLSTHGLHMAILREDKDLSADCVEQKTQRPGLEVLAEWAQWSDAEFAAWYARDDNPLRDGKTNGKSRISVPLGSYRYVLCMQPKWWEQLKSEARRDGVKWQSRVNLALCTNHRSLRSRLMSLEKQDSFQVRLRTDTWVASAQVAAHGKYATVLPSIADMPAMGLKDIGPLDKLEPEKVLLVFNPSILRVKLFRQMLHAVGCTISHALAFASQEKDSPAK
ncbi:MAG: LysR family transcriptional regulator [Verrucomicrobiales bacterium]|nr:LysR family transcriptional regulator [Verrucomicrobiales bacterium]MCP5560622.1 LysR family transcriptional regulator [Verrucomicrobiaceae bacterium]